MFADLLGNDRDAVYDKVSKKNGPSPMEKRTAGVAVDPNIHFGQPGVAGTRIPVYVVRECVEAGISFDEIIREHYLD